MPPWQKVVDPLIVMVAVGAAFTFTVTGALVAVHPLPFVTVTL